MNPKEELDEMFGQKIETKEKYIELLLFFIVFEGLKIAAKEDCNDQELLVRCALLNMATHFLGEDRTLFVMQKAKGVFEELIYQQVAKTKETSCN